MKICAKKTKKKTAKYLSSFIISNFFSETSEHNFRSWTMPVLNKHDDINFKSNRKCFVKDFMLDTHWRTQTQTKKIFFPNLQLDSMWEKKFEINLKSWI